MRTRDNLPAMWAEWGGLGYLLATRLAVYCVRQWFHGLGTFVLGDSFYPDPLDV